MKTALHLFRRDLRLEDNTALNFALTHAEEVYPCFIFDPRQIEQNRYKSPKAIAFMLSALADLDGRLKKKGGRLYLFEGIADQVIDKILAENQIDLLTLNRDYTPFSIKRDKKIASHCRSHAVQFHCFGDALLQEPETIHKADGTPYTIFTPFFKKAQKLPVRKPDLISRSKFGDKKLRHEVRHRLGKEGGRHDGLRLLTNIGKLKHYNKLRDFPAANHTTHLSAHNKFGTVSIREVYHKICKTFSKNHTLISELYWRDFFTHIAFHFPHVLGHAFRQKYDAIPWKTNQKHFKAWCEGKTGFPIVDAGMRELNQTGYMHNRVRMITASFLVKDLHLDWRLGERYFAQHLIDYDPAVNNGNWQWAASTGCDAQPYFRVFNPTSQFEKYDPDEEYVNLWCPKESFKPIVDHKKCAEQAKSLYKKCR
ncbi:MAG: Deoxyribodipyrimidine photo-lyase [Chlamydiales bacterium]|nr:Deoxyribodipyrimidine photo-lyase [Chlamydiales bacterium]MCH9619271.1 Deoxyribodipyrimidine photo-lyase [Chlamydiales bacterium]MCH9622533.1 Deoxyribodipyrimidine photo-lyase [Chlamydiales bacterium]